MAVEYYITHFKVQGSLPKKNVRNKIDMEEAVSGSRTLFWAWHPCFALDVKAVDITGRRPVRDQVYQNFVGWEVISPHGSIFFQILGLIAGNRS